MNDNRVPSPQANDGLPQWVWSACVLAAVVLSGFIFATLMNGADLPKMPGGRP